MAFRLASAAMRERLIFNVSSHSNLNHTWPRGAAIIRRRQAAPFLKQKFKQCIKSTSATDAYRETQHERNICNVWIALGAHEQNSHASARALCPCVCNANCNVRALPSREFLILGNAIRNVRAPLGYYFPRSQMRLIYNVRAVLGGDFRSPQMRLEMFKRRSRSNFRCSLVRFAMFGRPTGEPFHPAQIT